MTSGKTPFLVLASSSPRRQELIRSLLVPFDIIASDADESTEPGVAPAAVVETLSRRKAQLVFNSGRVARRDGTIVIGSDTIVVLGNRILGKPVDENDSFRMLQCLQGNTHDVYSGVCCIDAFTGEVAVGHRKTSVTMKSLDPETIMRYIRTGEPKDKAGSYAIQGLGATIVESIEGDYFNVVGLPLSLLSDMLGCMGVRVI